VTQSRPRVVILCGGQGTRLRDETEYRPKPLVPIGDRPILWHIMKTYASFGFVDFILALGYKGEMIRDYFLNYDLHYSDFVLQLGSKAVEYLGASHDESDWKITFVETGADTMTGGRLLRLEQYLVDDRSFMVTYGDGVTDLEIPNVLGFHESHGKVATVTGVRPTARFGELVVKGDQVTRFAEKPEVGDDWINGGYFVMTPRIFKYLKDDQTVLEREPLENLAEDNQLVVFKHSGYWQCMDTPRDLLTLNAEWKSGRAPWKRW
jgi:glucose-1-phosphate cytidylyltransferase